MTEMTEALAWCTAALGLVDVTADHTKEHGGHESATCRIRTPAGFAYLKVHQTPSHWHNEVHAYECWARAFGDFTPRLLAVHDQDPLALVVSELPGQILEAARLSPAQERAVWRKAGAALSALHDLGPGACFGPCRRDGSCAEAWPADAREFVSRRFTGQIAQAVRAGYINDAELAVLQAACELMPTFDGERPTPCHRDYCAANWLVSPRGDWAGVIDFEFAYWDVRVADFSRDPDWAWMRRPDSTRRFSKATGARLPPRKGSSFTWRGLNTPWAPSCGVTRTRSTVSSARAAQRWPSWALI